MKKLLERAMKKNLKDKLNRIQNSKSNEKDDKF